VAKWDDTPIAQLGGPPRALRAWTALAFTVITVSVFTTDPRPGFSGDGLGVLIAVLLTFPALPYVARRWDIPEARRIAGLLVLGVASCLYIYFQPDSAGFAWAYVVAVVAGMRLEWKPAVVVMLLVLGGMCTLLVLDHTDGAVGGPLGVIFSFTPWFLVMRAFRALRLKTDELHDANEELVASRVAAAEAAASDERSRVARDMHDVLAHSLSALALQLEGARLLARERGSDPEVVDAIERAHHLAASGLVEARQAIGALHGDDLPGPERLQELADAFAQQSSAATTLQVTGEPHEHASDARLALYRTAQEALTNIRKHSAADRVEIKLDYRPDGTRLLIQDHGPGAPVLVGGGYGLTGMRERAELLGGELTAEPTDDGFKVELWLPT
jgi:signal transduction histidine kinase